VLLVIRWLRLPRPGKLPQTHKAISEKTAADAHAAEDLAVMTLALYSRKMPQN
jgi:hypothetical protein